MRAEVEVSTAGVQTSPVDSVRIAATLKPPCARSLGVRESGREVRHSARRGQCPGGAARASTVPKARVENFIL